MMDMSNKHMRATGFKDIASDRISSLPDELLHHILSFMTAREAVQTCVLSMRWRHIWQSLRCLQIEVRKFTSKKGFVRFMDNILLRRGCVPLDSFHLMGWNGGVSLNHPRANLWVCHALRSNVRVLGISEYCELFNLDHSSFTSLHLKILNLSCVSISALFIEKLFSGCPALEDLAMVDCRVLATKFSSSTLKNLTFISLSPNEDYDVHNGFEDLVIDTPSLVSLHLEDLPFLAPCLVNVSSLVTASISPELCFSSFDANCNILGALSQVSHLKLLSPIPDNGTSDHRVNEVLRKDLLRCKTFINLKTLSVGEWCVDANLGALIHFLRCSPILEKLTVHLSMIGASVCDGQKDNPVAKETCKLFNCERLKKVRITCPQGDERVYDIVRIIIANASSLPKIVIDPFEHWE